MKRYIVSAALVLLILCGTQTAQARHPGYGWHDYGNGNGELVLEQDLAIELAQNLYRSPIDPVSQQLVKKIQERLIFIGGTAASRANLLGLFWTGISTAVRQQMIYRASIKNYEAYGFMLQWGLPYRCIGYSYDDYTLLREENNPAVYVVVADAKFWVPNGSYFNYEWNRIKVVKPGRLSGWSPYPNTNALLREQSSSAVYIIVVGSINPQYTWVSSTNQQAVVRRLLSYNAFVRLGLNWNNVRVVPNGAFNNPNPYLPRGYDWL